MINRIAQYLFGFSFLAGRSAYRISNKALKVVPNLVDHPALILLDKGIKVTINSDDPAYFGGYVNQNYIELIDGLKLGTAEIQQLIDNSLNARFV